MMSRRRLMPASYATRRDSARFRLVRGRGLGAGGRRRSQFQRDLRDRSLRQDRDCSVAAGDGSRRGFAGRRLRRNLCSASTPRRRGSLVQPCGAGASSCGAGGAAARARWRSSSSFLRRSASSELPQLLFHLEFEVVGGLAELVHELADLAADLRQTARPEDHQRQHHDDERVGHAQLAISIGGGVPMKDHDTCPHGAHKRAGRLRRRGLSSVTMESDGTTREWRMFN